MNPVRPRAFGLLCLALIVSMVVVGQAAAAEPISGPEPAAANPLAVTPLVTSECPPSYICFWSGRNYGQAECQAGLNCFSAFHGYEVGHHDLENINPRSVYNHTGEHTAVFIEYPFGLPPYVMEVGPGQTFNEFGRWEDGFNIE
jgi:Peptidase inhibitor family I36